MAAGLCRPVFQKREGKSRTAGQIQPRRGRKGGGDPPAGFRRARPRPGLRTQDQRGHPMFGSGKFQPPSGGKIEMAGGSFDLEDDAGQPVAAQPFPGGAQRVLFILDRQMDERTRIEPQGCKPAPIKRARFPAGVAHPKRWPFRHARDKSKAGDKPCRGGRVLASGGENLVHRAARERRQTGHARARRERSERCPVRGHAGNSAQPAQCVLCSVHCICSYFVLLRLHARQESIGRAIT